VDLLKIEIDLDVTVTMKSRPDQQVGNPAAQPDFAKWGRLNKFTRKPYLM